MSDSQNFGFAKFVPGFDFLQNLAKGAGGGMPQVSQLSSWIAPTLNVEELDKRIQELRAVHFWLEQNGKALAATIQALEVQKMTLSTLQGMNLSMSELAESMKIKPDIMSAAFSAPSAAGPAQPRAAADPAPSSFRSPDPAAHEATDQAEDGAAVKAKAKAAGKAAGKGSGQAGKAASPAGTPVDPLQWWGALTEQFQQIAATALKDVAQAGAAPASAKSPPSKAPSSKAAASQRAPTQPAAGPARKRAASGAGAPAPASTRAPRNPAKPRGRGASAACP
jgi:hypothetical protein